MEFGKKKVPNFCKLDGHRGVDIGKGVESCLNEWGFNNVLSISVDNASANDNAIEFMKMILEKNYNYLLKGKWMHIRCATHVINLIVQEGMKKVDNSIEGIRCAVKWIKKSGTRIEKFTKCAQSARCDSTKSLILDCPTRWNSTYAMLEVAHVYEDAFARYDLEAVDFGNHIRSKVASELVFSTSGQVLDSYNSSLGDKTIECLICTQDWLRVGLNLEKEEDMYTIAQIEKALMEQEGCPKFKCDIWLEISGCLVSNERNGEAFGVSYNELC
ncbi:zinc finger BED domain-containing protein RICESLEEPER 2-like protein [Tanacetum coccineum]